MVSGIIGKKIGMTQVFTGEGGLVSVTVVQAGPCTVVQAKTPARDSYAAVQLGFGQQKGFSLFVVMVPLKEQYRTEYLARDRDLVLKPQKKMKELCEKLGIPFLDLYPHMTAELFVNDGIHLTKEGRLRVGSTVAAFLLREKLLP